MAMEKKQTRRRLPGQARLPRYKALCASKTKYRELKRRDHLPALLRSEALAGDQLSNDYLDILEIVGRYRYVTADHVKTLLPGSERGIDRRLQQLFHHGYVSRLVRFQRLRVGLDFGSSKLAYVLDTRGWQALGRDRSEVASTIKWRKDHTRRAELFIEHQLAIASFRATLEAALRGRADLELALWRQDDGLRHSFSYRDALTRKPITVNVRPDAFFVVIEGRRALPFFLEVDMGSEDHSRLLDKFQRYYNYLRARKFADRYGEYNPSLIRVLFVMKEAGKPTKSWRRGETEKFTRFQRIFLPRHDDPKLSGTLALVRGKGEEIRRRFWFTRLDQYALARPSSILDPIWRRRGMKESAGHPLFGRQV